MRINTGLSFSSYVRQSNDYNKVEAAISNIYAGRSYIPDYRTGGLSYADRLRVQGLSIQTSFGKTADDLSMVKVASTALTGTQEILNKMQTLAEKAVNVDESDISRSAMNDEFSRLKAQLDEIVRNTVYNEKHLLDGSYSRQAELAATAAESNVPANAKLTEADAGGVTATEAAVFTNGAAGHFTDASVAVADCYRNTDELLGDYALAAERRDDGSIAVTAAGTNGKTFSAEIDQDSLKELSSGTPILTMNFSAGDIGAFCVNLRVLNNISCTDNNLEMLAENISKMDISVYDSNDRLNGGVDTHGYYTAVFGESPYIASLDQSSAAAAFMPPDQYPDHEPVDSIAFRADENDSYMYNGTYAVSASVNDDGSIAVSAEGDNGKTYYSRIEYQSLAALSEDLAEQSLSICFESTDFSSYTAFTMNISALSHVDINDQNLHVLADNLSKLHLTITGGTNVEDSTDIQSENKTKRALFDDMPVYIEKMDAQALGLENAKIDTKDAADAACSAVNNAMSLVSTQRKYLDHVENHLEKRLSAQLSELEKANNGSGRIIDVDTAKKFTRLMSINILQNTMTSLVAQGKVAPQYVLSLLR